MNKIIGERLREARELRGLGVNELGRMADVSGATISRWERGEREQPRLRELNKVLSVLGLEYQDLFTDLEDRAVRGALKKKEISSRDIRLVLNACPALTPAEIDVIMRVVESKEKERDGPKRSRKK